MIISLLLALSVFLAGNTPPKNNSGSKLEEQLLVAYTLDQHETVSTLLENLDKEDKEQASRLIAAGRFFNRQEEYTRAQLLLLSALTARYATNKEKAEVLYLVGVTALNKQQYNEALQSFQLARQHGYRADLCYYGLGVASYGEGHAAQALEHFKRAVKINPGLAEAWNLIGSYYYLNSKYSAALPNFLKANEAAGKRLAGYKVNLIRTYTEMQQKPQALQVAEDLYQNHPENDLGVIEFANALYNNGKYDQTKVVAKQAMRRMPDHAEPYYLYGKALSETQNADSAIYYYNNTLLRNVKHRRVYFNLGLWLANRGFFEDALKCYEICLDQPMADKTHVYYAMYHLYLWQNDYEKTYEWAVKYNKISYKPALANHALGYALMQLKRYEEAEKYLLKRLSYPEVESKDHNNLGRCYALQGKTEKAQEQFNKALQLNPENSYVYHNRASLYSSLGQHEKACADLRKAIELEYNWVIDENLYQLQKDHCSDLVLDRKIKYHYYKDLKQENYYDAKVSQLTDSLAALSANKHEVAFDSKGKNEEIPVLEYESKTARYEVKAGSAAGRYVVTDNFGLWTNLEVALFDETGKQVYRQKISGRQHQLDLTNMPSGNYALLVTSPTHVEFAYKVELPGES